MTITVDTGNITVATPQVNASSPQTFDHTCGANVDALVVVVTIYDTSSSDGIVSGVKYNGVSFDSPAATLYYDALSDGHVSVWLLPQPITGDSYSVEVSFGGVVTDFEAAAIGIESTVGTFEKDSNGTPATGTTGNLVITWNTVATNTIVFAAALDDQTDAGKVHPQEIEIYTVDVGDVVSAEYAIRTGSGSQTMTIVDDDGDEDWVIVGAGFKEITVPPPVISLNTATLTASGQSISVSAPQGEVFRIDFEEEDLSDFDSTTGEEDLAANATAAMVGSYGMEVTLDDTADHYGNNALSISTNDIRFRFYIDITPMSMTDGDTLNLQGINCDGTYSSITWFGWVALEFNSPNYQIRLAVWDDENTGDYTTPETITDGEHYIEVYIHRETTDGDADGTGEIWVDGISKGSLSNIDNWNIFPTIDNSRFGADDQETGTTGSLYLDDLIFRDDDTEIGSAGGIFIGLDTATLTANGQTLGLAPGAVTKLLDTATLIAGGQTLSLAPGEATTVLDTALLTAVGQALSLVMGETTIGLATAQLTANGQAISFLMGETTINLSTAQISANGQVITISLVTTVSLNTAQLTANGQVLSLAPGEVTIGLSTASLNANGQVITISLVTYVSLNTAALTANGQTLTLAPGAVTKSLNTATIAANGQSLSLSMGAVSTGLSTALLTANGQTVSLAPGAVSTGLNTAALTASGQGISLVMGAVSVGLDTAALIAGGQALSLSMGAVSVGLSTALITANGQVIVVIGVGAQTVILSTAALTAGGQSLALAPGAVSVGLSTAQLVISALTLAITAPREPRTKKSRRNRYDRINAMGRAHKRYDRLRGRLWKR